MRERDPKLPEKMTGGLRNPLGAMALYLGSTLYRIHGTNDVKSIGQAQSSGCFRMMNGAVMHLAGLVDVGTPVDGRIFAAGNTRPEPGPATNCGLRLPSTRGVTIATFATPCWAPDHEVYQVP